MRRPEKEPGDNLLLVVLVIMVLIAIGLAVAAAQDPRTMQILGGAQ